MSNKPLTLLVFIFLSSHYLFAQRALHRVNLIDSKSSNGLKYDGSDVRIIIREQGFATPHIDIQNRLDNRTPQLSFDDHQDWVVGCIGGAGNIDPKIRGMASASELYIIEYIDNIANAADSTLSLHKKEGAVIVNSSYADFGVCNQGNTSHATAIDRQLFANPTLMHVFVAGNAGQQDCGYGVGNLFGNLEGGHLTAKNAIAVGSVNLLGFLSNFSSKGPTKDGRLKPDLVALGEDYPTIAPTNSYTTVNGTSFSSPAVAGIMAQLYQAYKEMNGGINPPSALIKSVMCNTAEDLGNLGPDYKHGFGLVHAGRAYESLANRQYIADSLPVTGPHSHSLQIPVGISEARVMLYWPDKEAIAGSAKTLISDLDITLSDTANNTYLPLVLDPTPNLTALNRPAQPGIDTLNNIEQIVLKNPQAGTYQIHVEGTAMPVGKTGYYLTWFFFKDELQVTFPYGGEAFAPQEDLIIRWDAYSDTGSFEVDYTLDNGRNWTSIATNVNGALRYQMWQTPAQISGQARIRVTRGPQSSESTQNFTLIESPQNIQFARVCQDFVTLTWDAVPGATAYDIFVLGEKYMDSVGTTTNTFFEPKIRYQNENWFSVRARGDSGIVGRRAIAVKQALGNLVNCAGVAPTAMFNIDTILCDSQFVFLKDQSLKSPDAWQWSVSPAQGVSFIQNTAASSDNPTLSFADTGTYQITLQVTSQFGIDSSTQTVLIKSCTTPIEDDFEKAIISVFPNPNDGIFQLKIVGNTLAHYQLEVIDLQGKKVHHRLLKPSGNQMEQTVNFSYLPAGIYFLRIYDGKHDQVVKIVKK